MTKKLPAYLQPGPPAGSGYSKEYYECTDCGYINYDGYKKETNKESLGKGFICPNCGGMELNPLEDTPPMSARDRYAKVKSSNYNIIAELSETDFQNIEKLYDAYSKGIEDEELLNESRMSLYELGKSLEEYYQHDWDTLENSFAEKTDLEWAQVYVRDLLKSIKSQTNIMLNSKEFSKTMVALDTLLSMYHLGGGQLIDVLEHMVVAPTKATDKSYAIINNIKKLRLLAQKLFEQGTKKKKAQHDIHISKPNWSFDMENGEIKLSLGNLSDAGWFWDGDASDLNGYLVRMSTSQVKNEFITEMERVGMTLQDLKPYIVDSINNGNGVYEITGDNATWRFGNSEPDLKEELEDVEGLTEADKEGIAEKFWGYFSINFDDFSTDYGQIFREEFTARLGSSNTIGDYLTAIQDMRLLGAEQYQEYEMFAVNDALIKAKEEWENSKQPDIKPLEQFGQLRINKVVITVPHAIGTGDNLWDIKKHFQDAVAQDIAEGVYSILKEKVSTQLFVSDKPRKEVDYNRPNSRTTEWRRKVDKELGKNTLLVDIHSYDKGFPKFENYDVIIFKEQGNEKLIKNLMNYSFNGVKVGVYANGPDGIYYSIVKDALGKRIPAIMVEVNEHSKNMNSIISELAKAILTFVGT